jgi:hypothetical protein
MGGLEVGKMKVERLVKRVEGWFQGVKRDDVEEPRIVVVDYYPTMRYGYLPKFGLVVPKNSKVTRVTREWYSPNFPGQPYVHIEYIVECRGRVWYFTLSRGDAMEPDYMYQGEDEYAKKNPPTIHQVWELDPDE